jgi:hypothetical protein
MLFISSSEAAQVPRILEKVRNLKGVLSISDISGFTGQGGMIELFVERNHIRFAVNLGATTQAGLELSSKLLRLATRIEQARGP